MNTKTVSRNDPCPCGSGKKYKQCCQATDASNSQKIVATAQLRKSLPDLFEEAINHHQLGQLKEAEDLYQQILAIWPNHPSTLQNLGAIALQTQRITMAVQLLQKAADLEPSEQYYYNLAQALSSNSQNSEAIEYLHKSIHLNPSYSIAINSLGAILALENRFEEAIPYFHQALGINPEDDQSLHNIGYCLMRQSNYSEAANYLRQAIAINPHIDSYHHSLLFCLCFDRHAAPSIYLQEASYLDRLFKARSTPYQQSRNTLLAPTQLLRVGIVSGDLRNHPVGYFLEHVITHLNKSHIELVAYNTQLFEDELTARIKPHFSQWVNITHFNDELAAKKIYDDGIHILIDLSGYTEHTRLSLFAWKPAPIQVSWLGYFASTGLSCIDYFLTDAISVPAENHSHFSEKIAYLPNTRLCFTPPTHDIPQEINELPATHHGFITFGCFQDLSKINDHTLALWATILQACPQSKLMFKNHQLKNAHTKQQLLTRLNKLGIVAEQIILEEGGSRAQYFKAYHSVDFMLDTFPFPGGTTTCEALWMGVPTLTLAGNTLLQRQGMSFLNCVGLNTWIAYDEVDYIQKAIFYAHNLNPLHHLRSTLRETMATSPLVDAARFAKDVEQALLAMWQEKYPT